MHTHTHDTLERFRERWRSHSAPKKASTRDIQVLKLLHITKLSIRCGRLYHYSAEHSTEVRANDDLCKTVAKLHAMGLLEMDRGYLLPNEAALDVLINFNKLQA